MAEEAAAVAWQRLTRAVLAGRDPRIGLVAKEVVYDLAREMAAAPIPIGLEQDVREAGGTALGFLPQALAAFPAAFDNSVRELDESERDVLILTDLRGLTDREAADVLGTSRMTIHRRRDRARQILREEIAA